MQGSISAPSTRTRCQQHGVRDPQAALVCAARSCLAAPSSLSFIPSTTHHISTTFDALAHRPIAHLCDLAGAYDSRALERALWASAVEHLALSPSHRREPAELRAALVGLAKWERERMDMDVVVAAVSGWAQAASA